MSFVDVDADVDVDLVVDGALDVSATLVVDFDDGFGRRHISSSPCVLGVVDSSTQPSKVAPVSTAPSKTTSTSTSTIMGWHRQHVPAGTHTAATPMPQHSSPAAQAAGSMPGSEGMPQTHAPLRQ